MANVRKMETSVQKSPKTYKSNNLCEIPVIKYSTSLMQKSVVKLIIHYASKVKAKFMGVST